MICYYRIFALLGKNRQNKPIQWPTQSQKQHYSNVLELGSRLPQYTESISVASHNGRLNEQIFSKLARERRKEKVCTKNYWRKNENYGYLQIQQPLLNLLMDWKLSKQ